MSQRRLLWAVTIECQCWQDPTMNWQEIMNCRKSWLNVLNFLCSHFSWQATWFSNRLPRWLASWVLGWTPHPILCVQRTREPLVMEQQNLWGVTPVVDAMFLYKFQEAMKDWPCAKLKQWCNVQPIVLSSSLSKLLLSWFKSKPKLCLIMLTRKPSCRKPQEAYRPRHNCELFR